MKNIRQHIKNVLIEENQNNNVEMVKQIIYELFDEVSFIEQSTYEDKPLLKIYFDSDSEAANIESWFANQITNTISEYTADNIIVCPYWKPDWDWRKKAADVYIDTILLKYDNLGNVINENYLIENDDKKEVEKNLKVIEKIIKMIDVEGLCNIWVTYNPEDGDYEIRSKTTIRYYDRADMTQELGFIESSIKSLGLRTYIFSPYYVENCDEEIEYMD